MKAPDVKTKPVILSHLNRIIESAAIACVLLVLGSCSEGKPLDTSMIAIIAAPQEYDKAKVFTQGFFSMKQEARLFVSREDALNYNDYHSILMDESDIGELAKLKACDNKFVSVTGTIAYDGRARLRMLKPISIQSKNSAGYVAVSCKLSISST